MHIDGQTIQLELLNTSSAELDLNEKAKKTNCGVKLNITVFFPIFAIATSKNFTSLF